MPHIYLSGAGVQHAPARRHSRRCTGDVQRKNGRKMRNDRQNENAVPTYTRSPSTKITPLPNKNEQNEPEHEPPSSTSRKTHHFLPSNIHHPPPRIQAPSERRCAASQQPTPQLAEQQKMTYLTFRQITRNRDKYITYIKINVQPPTCTMYAYTRLIIDPTPTTTGQQDNNQQTATDQSTPSGRRRGRPPGHAPFNYSLVLPYTYYTYTYITHLLATTTNSHNDICTTGLESDRQNPDRMIEEMLRC